MKQNTLVLLILVFFITQTFGQNFGVGEPFATSRLQIKGTGNTAATSSFNVTNSTGNSLLFVRDDGNIGINTIAPTEGLHIIDKNFAVTATVGSGQPLSLSGAGIRMFFYSQKAAFRSGYVDDDQWNAANIGPYSIATGYNTKANGYYSTAFGFGSVASTNYSTAMGYSTTANGSSATAMGNGTIASGQSATAMGRSSVASGQSATAMGENVSATSFREVSLGSFNTTVLGATPTSWVATDRLFTIGNGEDINTKSDALVMLKNGNTILKGALTLTNGTSSFTLPQADGTAGQVLTTDGSGAVSWGTASAGASYTAGTGIAIANGVISNTGDLSATNELELPVQTGNTGKYLTTDGTNVSWETVSGSGTSLNGAYNEGGAGAGRTITANNGAVLVNGTDGLQVTGTAGSGATLALSGPGIRMFFYPKKAAFRAGEVTATQWDDANIGDYSTAIGRSTKASGGGSTALGYATTANGWASTALGYFTNAIGAYSSAIGFSSAANGHHSMAMGLQSNANAWASFSIGNKATANGSYSIAMGDSTKTSGISSTAMGKGTNAIAYGETAMGLFNTTASPSNANAWVATDRLFTIGNGTNPSNQSDALVILKNGNTTLKGALTLTNGTSSFTLPQTDGTAGQVLVTDGSGLVSWASISGVSNSLNGAYNNGGAGLGRTITADNGAVLVQGVDGFQVTGSGSNGVNLALAGAGTRMFFYPKKAAFRAGNVTGTQWDDANIDYASVAMGENTIANGMATTAMGSYTIAHGNYSTAMGTGSIANGMVSVAIGDNAKTYHDNCVSIGKNTNASGEYSLAMGYETTTFGMFSTVIGATINATGDNTVAMGDSLTANGRASVVIGKGLIGESYGETVVGTHNANAASPDQYYWVGTDRLFTIGNGTSITNKSNALVMLKNGNTTLKGALTLTNGTSSFTLPQTDGTAGQVLVTDGSGVVSWGTAAGGGGSLNAAYNFGGAGAGSTITADNGAVLVQGVDGLQVTGTFGSGASLTLSGAGTRMFFYPKKAAFRAGYSDGIAWDNDSIGNYSTAMGYNTTANGTYSTAMGLATIARGDFSTAMGYFTKASGYFSTAMGSNTQASGDYSTTMGISTIASGHFSTAMGYVTKASGNYSTAMGYITFANGDYSNTMGRSITASAYSETVMGAYNTIASSANPTAFVATDRLFTIGNGTGIGAKSDALVMLKNGNTTLKGALTLTNGTSSYTLPQTDGTAGQVLTTDGSGAVAWTSPSGGSGGSGSGGGTLNTAYNFGGAGVGRTITADNDAVLVNGTDGFQVTGAVGNGTSLSLSGAGTRMFFYPKKAAFRAGNVAGTEWDDVNIGESSIAMGKNTNASNISSIAIGRFAKATGYASISLGDSANASATLSTAIGYKTTASSEGAVAIGYQATASGDVSLATGYNTVANSFASTAMGVGTTASANYATAMGQNTTASGTTSIATGYQTTASGVLSTAIGSYSTASGDFSIAMGQAAISSGQLSIAMGHYTVASGKATTAMGEATKAESFAETSIGMYSTSAVSPNPDNWVATDRIFTIGNGSGSGAFSDALVMLKNGNTTLKGALTLTNGTSSFTLPQTDGTAGQVLTTNGSGVVSWGTAAGGGGSLNTAYNSGGAGAGCTITADNGAVLVNGTDGFQVTGTSGSGASLSLSGAGTRMFFYPKKAAFRAGTVTGTQWDDANIGDNSIAMGKNATANGLSSISIGEQANASGANSTAIGDQTVSSGLRSTAVGYNTVASGQFSTAMGVQTVASAYGSTSIGVGTFASGYRTTAMGFSTKADAYCETVIGSFNTAAAFPNGTSWTATDRLFTIGNGENPFTLSDALIMLKNGNTTLNGNLSVNGTLCSTSGTVVSCSDIRYKQNILPISAVSGSALAKVAAINGYYYDFRMNEFPEKKFSDAKQIGFIAQELEKVYPELVITDDKGYKSVDYAKITPVLVEAIKELKAENDALKAKNAHLEANDSEIKAKIEALENAVYGNAKR